jgi:hypothetical protein
MKGILMMLKSLGVNITDKDLKTVEAIIPQIPAKVNEIVAFIRERDKNFEERLRALEVLTFENNQLLQEICRDGKRNRSIGNSDSASTTAGPGTGLAS